VHNNAVALARVALPQAQDACGSGDHGRRNEGKEHAHAPERARSSFAARKRK
jgi:hypothetical protein